MCSWQPTVFQTQSNRKWINTRNLVIYMLKNHNYPTTIFWVYNNSEMSHETNHNMFILFQSTGYLHYIKQSVFIYLIRLGGFEELPDCPLTDVMLWTNLWCRGPNSLAQSLGPLAVGKLRIAYLVPGVRPTNKFFSYLLVQLWYISVNLLLLFTDINPCCN